MAIRVVSHERESPDRRSPTTGAAPSFAAPAASTRSRRISWLGSPSSSPIALLVRRAGPRRGAFLADGFALSRSSSSPWRPREARGGGTTHSRGSTRKAAGSPATGTGSPAPISAGPDHPTPRPQPLWPRLRLPARRRRGDLPASPPSPTGSLPAAEEIRARQTAVADLAPRRLRDKLAALAAPAAFNPGDVEHFLSWAEGEPWLLRRQRSSGRLALAAVNIALIAADVAG